MADNLIDTFDQLEFLTIASDGHMLRALSLEGNPVARLPHYRSVHYISKAFAREQCLHAAVPDVAAQTKLSPVVNPTQLWLTIAVSAEHIAACRPVVVSAFSESAQ